MLSSSLISQYTYAYVENKHLLIQFNFRPGGDGSEFNAPVPCESLPDIDLQFWADD
jgi:hypothetical protein